MYKVRYTSIIIIHALYTRFSRISVKQGDEKHVSGLIPHGEFVPVFIQVRHM